MAEGSTAGSYLTDSDFTVMLFTGAIGETLNADGAYKLDFTGANYVTQSSSSFFTFPLFHLSAFYSRSTTQTSPMFGWAGSA